MKDEQETAAAMLRATLAAFPGSKGHWLIGQLRAIEQFKLIGPGSRSTGLNARDRWPG